MRRMRCWGSTGSAGGSRRAVNKSRLPFVGDRAGSVVDPFGHKWTILTHKEEGVD